MLFFIDNSENTLTVLSEEFLFAASGMGEKSTTVYVKVNKRLMGALFEYCEFFKAFKDIVSI